MRLVALDHRSAGWATCPVTENGFLRVLSSAAYGRDPLRPELLVARLRKFRASGAHVFWADSVTLSDERLFNLAMAAGSRQITDVYLLGLARKMRRCLATFDRGIPVRAVIGATASTLHVIGPGGES
jgi:uncharacterized protein